MLAPNGKIYGIPQGAPAVLVIDPVADTVDDDLAVPSSDNWIDGVLASNGKIYGIPHHALAVLIIDPSLDGHDEPHLLVHRALDRAFAPNGNIYGIPGAHPRC